MAGGNILQILIILLSSLSSTHVQQQQQQQQTAMGTTAAAATTTTTSSSSSDTELAFSDVKEIFGVKIERNPPQSKLHLLGVSSWPKWGCGPSKFPWTFTANETMYLLEGKVKVFCEGHEDESFEIVGGDLVQFPKGMKITWDAIEAVNKHYNLEK